MRDDLLAVCLESGRGGNHIIGHRGVRQKVWHEEDVAVPESMLRTHIIGHRERKQPRFSDCVIRKVLHAAIGRPWSMVRSDLMHALAGTGTLAARVRSHALDLVEEQTVSGSDGRRYTIIRCRWQTDGGPSELDDGSFYVDDHGALRAYVARKRREQPSLVDSVTINGEYYERIQGLWYHLIRVPRPRGTRWSVGGRFFLVDRTKAEQMAVTMQVSALLITGLDGVTCALRGCLPFISDGLLLMRSRSHTNTETHYVVAKRQISGKRRDRLGLAA